MMMSDLGYVYSRFVGWFSVAFSTRDMWSICRFVFVCVFDSGYVVDLSVGS